MFRLLLRVVTVAFLLSSSIALGQTPPAISIADASVIEGDSGSTSISFTVTLSSPSTSTVTALYSTSGVTATGGVDFIAFAGGITFQPGDTTVTISMPVLGDTAPEPDETLSVVVSFPVNAVIADGEAVGTIIDDDAAGIPALDVVGLIALLLALTALGLRRLAA